MNAPGQAITADFSRPAAAVEGWWRPVLRDRSGLAGLVLVGVFFALAIGGWSGLLGAGWSQSTGGQWESASASHWFGTNQSGQDIFARALQGTRTAFETGLLVSASAVLLGAVLGGVAGWRSGQWPDAVILWLMGVLDSIPFYLFAAALAFAMAGNPWGMQLAMVVTFWTGTARLVRGEVMRLKEREFVSAARAIGLPGHSILSRHVLPNTGHILLVQATLTLVAAIKTEVILSFLGLGVQNGVSWGLMLSESAQDVLAGHFGNFLAASGFLFLLLLGFNLLADALQKALNVQASGE